MKTTIFNKKALAFFGAAAILLAAVFTIGCKTDKRSGTPAPETFTVEMTAGEHGTLSANPAIPAGGKVAKDKVITFTATPTDGYGVDKWTITGGTFEAETGTDGSTTAKVKITANTTVKVSFYKEYVKVALAGLDNHLKNTAPDTDGIYYIEVTGLTAADLKGEYTYPVKPSALGKILNDNPTKKVALKLSEVSGLTDISACFFNCKSLTQAPVIPSSVTNMQGCFIECTSLTQAPMIPSSVTNMSYCFDHCTNLTQAPVIPSTVTNMKQCFSYCEKITAVTLKCNYNAAVVDGDPVFKDAFYGCKKLTAGSIKVPAGQLQTYKDNAATMGAQKEWFVAE